MKKFFEGLKDFLYDSVDYIIMIGIVGIVVLVIAWRLDLLFAKDALDVPPKNNIVENNKDNENNKPDSIDDNQEQTDNKPTDSAQDNNSGNNDTETPPQDSSNQNQSNDGKIVKITIPSGSLPSKIGSILESNGLVSKTDFVQKAQELNLDTKLKSGDYEIKVGTSVEEIVKLIADKK